MFSKKPESFKYEVEVNALIREATTGLNQRLVALEVQNNQLILHNQKLEYELNALRHSVYADVQRLEKRITDFTDLWHPIMSENMNRIKAELETTIREAEREDIQKLSFELENKLTKIVEDYKADKCIRQICRIPEQLGTSIKLSSLANKLNEWVEMNRNDDTQRSYNGAGIDIFGIAHGLGITITDDENNVILKGDLIQIRDSNRWKLFFENDAYYKLINYITDNCHHITFMNGGGQQMINIEMPQYHPAVAPYSNCQMAYLTFEAAIKNYDKIRKIVQRGGKVTIDLWN